MPAILEDAVKSIMKENPDMKKGAAYAIATTATEKGNRRGEMSKSTRAKTRARKYKEERKRGKKDERNTSDRD